MSHTPAPGLTPEPGGLLSHPARQPVLAPPGATAPAAPSPPAAAQATNPLTISASNTWARLLKSPPGSRPASQPVALRPQRCGLAHRQSEGLPVLVRGGLRNGSLDQHVHAVLGRQGDDGGAHLARVGVSGRESEALQRDKT